MNYPGPGQGIEIGGSYGPVSPVAWNDSATGHAWTGSAPFGVNAAVANLMFNVPKLAAGDSWTQAYLTFFLSSNATVANYNVQLDFDYRVVGGGHDTHFGGAGVSPVSTVSLAGGAPLPPVQVGTFYPYLVTPPSQGIAKAYFIDFANYNDPVDYLQSALASANDYNASGIQQANTYSGFTSDLNLAVTATTNQGGGGGGSTLTIYNPVLTMFSLLQYAWIPPSAGGFTIAPEMLALGMFGRGRVRE